MLSLFSYPKGGPKGPQRGPKGPSLLPLWGNYWQSQYLAASPEGTARDKKEKETPLSDREAQRGRCAIYAQRAFAVRGPFVVAPKGQRHFGPPLGPAIYAKGPLPAPLGAVCATSPFVPLCSCPFGATKRKVGFADPKAPSAIYAQRGVVPRRGKEMPFGHILRDEIYRETNLPQSVTLRASLLALLLLKILLALWHILLKNKEKARLPRCGTRRTNMRIAHTAPLGAGRDAPSPLWGFGHI